MAATWQRRASPRQVELDDCGFERAAIGAAPRQFSFDHSARPETTQAA